MCAFEDIVSYFIKAFRGNRNGLCTVRDEPELRFRKLRAQFPYYMGENGWVLENDNVTRTRSN